MKNFICMIKNKNNQAQSDHVETYEKGSDEIMSKKQFSSTESEDKQTHEPNSSTNEYVVCKSSTIETESNNNKSKSPEPIIEMTEIKHHIAENKNKLDDSENRIEEDCIKHLNLNIYNDCFKYLSIFNKSSGDVDSD